MGHVACSWNCTYPSVHGCVTGVWLCVVVVGTGMDVREMHPAAVAMNTLIQQGRLTEEDFVVQLFTVDMFTRAGLMTRGSTDASNFSVYHSVSCCGW